MCECSVAWEMVLLERWKYSRMISWTSFFKKTLWECNHTRLKKRIDYRVRITLCDRKHASRDLSLQRDWSAAPNQSARVPRSGCHHNFVKNDFKVWPFAAVLLDFVRTSTIREIYFLNLLYDSVLARGRSRAKLGKNHIFCTGASYWRASNRKINTKNELLHPKNPICLNSIKI